jgi:hypothetical protein
MGEQGSLPPTGPLSCFQLNLATLHDRIPAILKRDDVGKITCAR